ncbi:vWA domain-containing protein [Succinivibrio dextrinosolvens]|uniref:vWA domain-containing protein n=1 Tax=Succinivibrio dextrinosolvens TaxID=83771 RepID=UPI00241C629A|nr:vWA domain-containing protein [Succinivibrio dextrinosolvens]
MNNITRTVINDRLQGIITLAGSIKDYRYSRKHPKIVLSRSEGACTDGESIWLPVQTVAQDYYNRAKINALLLHERGHNLYTPDYKFPSCEQNELANVVEDIKIDFLTRSLIRSGNSLWVNLVMEYTDVYLKRGVTSFGLSHTFNLLVLTEGYIRIAIHSGNERLVEKLGLLKSCLDKHLATQTTLQSAIYMGGIKAQVDAVFMLIANELPTFEVTNVVNALWELYKKLLKNRTSSASENGKGGNKAPKKTSSQAKSSERNQNNSEKSGEDSQNKTDESSDSGSDENSSSAESSDSGKDSDKSDKTGQNDSSEDSDNSSNDDKGSFFFDDFKEELKSESASQTIDEEAKDFLDEDHIYEIQDYENSQRDGVDFCSRTPSLPTKAEMDSFLNEVKYARSVNEPSENSYAKTYKASTWNRLIRVSDVRKETAKLKKALKAYKPKFYTIPKASGSVLRQNALHRLATGKYEPKPFLKKGKGRDLSTEVCFLLDVSGSMHGNSICSLVKTMSYLQHVMSEIKTRSLTTSIYAFEDRCYLVKKAGPTFKPEDLKKIPKPRNSTYGYAALRQVTRELIQRKANRKILICLTDGSWTDTNSRFNLDVYQNLGIESYGVYLDSDPSASVESLKKYSDCYPNFPSWFVVDTNNIRKFYLTLLEELLTVGKN